MDLGTAVQEYDEAVRTAKKGGKAGSRRLGKRSEAAAELAASGVQIRPKRRMPVSKVGMPRLALVPA